MFGLPSPLLPFVGGEGCEIPPLVAKTHPIIYLRVKRLPKIHLPKGKPPPAIPSIRAKPPTRSLKHPSYFI